MGFRLFDRKYVFFEEFDHGVNAEHGSRQAQQYDLGPLVREELIQEEVLGNNEQQEDKDKNQKLFHKQKKKGCTQAAVSQAF